MSNISVIIDGSIGICAGNVWCGYATTVRTHCRALHDPSEPQTR